MRTLITIVPETMFIDFLRIVFPDLTIDSVLLLNSHTLIEPYSKFIILRNSKSKVSAFTDFFKMLLLSAFVDVC